MARFHVRRTFTVEGRPHFILAGSIVEGEIRPGMFVNLESNPSVAMTAAIDCIEFARRLGGQEDTCLCIRYTDPDELEVWRGLNINGETVEVTIDGLD